jgi:class 3 adenylate cyclase
MAERQMRTVSIAFTDLVSSTALFSRLGEDAAERLRTHHFSVLRQAIALFGGSEVKNLGDGLMIAFGSSTEAAHCAVEMQRSICDDNHRRRSDPLAIRIGLTRVRPAPTRATTSAGPWSRPAASAPRRSRTRS